MKKIAIMLFVLLAVITLAGCDAFIQKPADEVTEATDDDLKLLSYYMKAFGHDRVLGDTDAVLKGGKVEGLTFTQDFNKEALTLTLEVTLKDYDYDGHATNDALGVYQRLATGTVTVVYSGKMDADGVTFKADKATFTEADGTASVGYASIFPVDSVDITAEEVTATFTDKEKENASTVDFTITDGKAVAITNVGDVSFALGDVINLSINGRIVADTVPETPVETPSDGESA